MFDLLLIYFMWQFLNTLLVTCTTYGRSPQIWILYSIKIKAAIILTFDLHYKAISCLVLYSILSILFEIIANIMHMITIMSSHSQKISKFTAYACMLQAEVAVSINHPSVKISFDASSFYCDFQNLFVFPNKIRSLLRHFQYYTIFNLN